MIDYVDQTLVMILDEKMRKWWGERNARLKVNRKIQIRVFDWNDDDNHDENKEEQKGKLKFTDLLTLFQA